MQKGTKERTGFQETEAKRGESNKIPYVKAFGKTQQKDHDDHIAEKGFNSLSRYNLVHKFSDASHDEKIRMGKQQWTRNGRRSKSCQLGN